MRVIVQRPLQFRRTPEMVQDPGDSLVHRYPSLPLFPRLPSLLEFIPDIVHPASEALVLVQFVHHDSRSSKIFPSAESSVCHRVTENPGRTPKPIYTPRESPMNLLRTFIDHGARSFVTSITSAILGSSIPLEEPRKEERRKRKVER